MGGKSWTEGEKEYLKARWTLDSHESVAQHLGRSAQATHEMALRLGLKAVPRTGGSWTSDEVQVLRANWPEVKRISGLLGRRRDSILKKAGDLGLVLAPKEKKLKKSGWATRPATRPAPKPTPVPSLAQARGELKKKPGRIGALCGWKGL